MMKGVIRLGDKTNHNGCVLTASKTIVVRGKGVARVGDKVSCPKKDHGPTTIIEGDPNITDHGIPIAFDGHKCACGCSLISSMPLFGKK